MTDKEFVARAEAMTLSAEYAEQLAPIFIPVQEVLVAARSGDLARVTGRPARRLVDYLSDNA